MLGSVARRYAKAIFALAREQSVHESVAQELARVVATASDPTVASTLRNPVLSSARLHALVDTSSKSSHSPISSRAFSNYLPSDAACRNSPIFSRNFNGSSIENSDRRAHGFAVHRPCRSHSKHRL